MKLFDSIIKRIAEWEARRIVSKVGSTRQFLQEANASTQGELKRLIRIMSQLDGEEAWMVFQSWRDSGDEKKRAAATFVVMASLATDEGKPLNRGKGMTRVDPISRRSGDLRRSVFP